MKSRSASEWVKA
jgi:hypothetical protein